MVKKTPAKSSGKCTNVSKGKSGICINNNVMILGIVFVIIGAVISLWPQLMSALATSSLDLFVILWAIQAIQSWFVFVIVGVPIIIVGIILMIRSIKR